MERKKEIKIYLNKISDYPVDRLEVQIFVGDKLIACGDTLEEAMQDFDNTYIDKNF